MPLIKYFGFVGSALVLLLIGCKRLAATVWTQA
jgi:hypothetical protein